MTHSISKHHPNEAVIVSTPTPLARWLLRADLTFRFAVRIDRGWHWESGLAISELELTQALDDAPVTTI